MIGQANGRKRQRANSLRRKYTTVKVTRKRRETIGKVTIAVLIRYLRYKSRTSAASASPTAGSNDRSRGYDNCRTGSRNATSAQ